MQKKGELSHSKKKCKLPRVAHAQPSGAAQQRYDQLCRSIPKHAEQCVRQRKALMDQLFSMAEEVHELKAVCRELHKPYEAEAIRLCGGETTFHYVRDLYTACDGNRQKALECGKAPYTLLREFRKQRAEKNRQAKASTASRIKKPAPRQGAAARIAAGPGNDNDESDKVIVPPLTTPRTATATVDSACDGNPKQYGDQLSAALATIKKLVNDDPWETLLEVINALGLKWAEVAAWAQQRAEWDRDGVGPATQEVNIDTTLDEFVEV
jgi:hypothetical protein